MKFNAPTQIVFLISLVVAVVGVLAALNVLHGIPVASVWIVTIAYIILAGGCLLKNV